MTIYLSRDNFPAGSSQLSEALESVIQNDFNGNFFEMFGDYQRILADNKQRTSWSKINDKLQTLFMCGKSVPLDGPMIGIPLSIRDSDYFQDTIQHLGRERARIASIEWMATAWNMTFADTGLWMGKSFEPVSKETVAKKCGNDKRTMDAFNPQYTRIGRNFFREPTGNAVIQGISMPVLTRLWHLKDRPLSTSAIGFDGKLTRTNIEREKFIPYTKTGGMYLGNFGRSVIPEMQDKAVYQLNYRWPALHPSYPMTRLIDELVQVADGIYLGQLIYATKNYSLGSLRLPFCPDLPEIPFGEPYDPYKKHPLDLLWRHFSETQKDTAAEVDYGYQNNGYFLMMAPDYAKEVYAEKAFPQLRPREGEAGYVELGYGKDKTGKAATISPTSHGQSKAKDWVNGWKEDNALKEKFTTFILEPSPKETDTQDIQQMLGTDESILQMLQRISDEISSKSNYDDQLHHFEKLHRLFRAGVAPVVDNGSFLGHGPKGYNVRVDGKETRNWYGVEEKAKNFDYYHGANLNLHMGFKETFCPDAEAAYDDSQLFPSSIASSLEKISGGPNILNMTWHSIGKYIFPWAGKSFEKISGRKLSMFLDESDDLSERYPDRVTELKSHLASAPHYDLIEKNAKHHWMSEGPYMKHLKSGAWDQTMSEEDKAFWEKEAEQHWVDGTNIQDERIVSSDPLLHIIDMNYRVPDSSLQAISEQGPSPFARQGYIFLGVSDRDSILPMNNGTNSKKKVFQFHYRYPMIGGPVPIGFCLDELVEIADGLFLGQLIYSTALNVPFNSSVDPAEYKYQLFGYFLLLDDEWQSHRLAIGLDTLKSSTCV